MCISARYNIHLYCFAVQDSHIVECWISMQENLVRSSSGIKGN